MDDSFSRTRVRGAPPRLADIPVEDWIPEKPFDSAEYLGRPAPVYAADAAEPAREADTLADDHGG